MNNNKTVRKSCKQYWDFHDKRKKRKKGKGKE